MLLLVQLHFTRNLVNAYHYKLKGIHMESTPKQMHIVHW